MHKFTATADSRETSQEIIDAIWEVSGKNEAEAVRVWESPREEEVGAIWEIVTKNGLRKATDYCWGTNGSRWYEALTA
jgi:hypothetical protein